MSAIVALALAAVVTFTAGINSYGIPKSEEMIVYDIQTSLERAYEDVIEEEVNFSQFVDDTETIKIFDKDNNLVDTVELSEGEVIEDAATKKLLNRAQFLSSYGSTSVYQIAD